MQKVKGQGLREQNYLWYKEVRYVMGKFFEYWKITELDDQIIYSIDKCSVNKEL